MSAGSLSMADAAFPGLVTGLCEAQQETSTVRVTSMAKTLIKFSHKMQPSAS